MANGNSKDGIAGPIIRTLFGDAGRFVLLGIALALLYNAAVNFKEDVMEEAAATRQVLNEYIASNKAWQDLTLAERQRLLKKTNARLRRLYERNGWQYEDIEP